MRTVSSERARASGFLPGAALLCAALLTACGGGSGAGESSGGAGGGGGGVGGGGGGGGTTQSYTVGGAITGLSGSGLVLQDNAGDDLAPTANGAFTFATKVPGGSAYAVTVKTQPSSPSQTCALANASGTVGATDVANVVLTCTTNSFGVGVTVTGLSGTGLVLQDNGGDDLSVSANGILAFAKNIASGEAYNISVKTAPSAPTQVCAVTNGSGTIGSAPVNVTIACGPIALLAGGLGGGGTIDGQGALARFTYPYGIAADSAGNLYVADSENSAIRKITPTGVVSTFAGTPRQVGSADGSNKDARFIEPFGMAVDLMGNVYVTDEAANTVRKITPDGLVSTLAGNPGNSGSTNGHGSDARFYAPQGLAIDSAGNLYVADTGNSTIRKITSAGDVTTVAGTPGKSGTTDGDISLAQFNRPQDLVVDSAGNIYVADTESSTIRKIDVTKRMVSTVAGEAGVPGSSDGNGKAAHFRTPTGMVLDAAGNLYVTDVDSNTIRKINPAGDVSTLAGADGERGSVDGSAQVARFGSPVGIAMDSAGNSYVTDSSNQTIRKVSRSGDVSTFAGATLQIGTIDGSGDTARFSYPFGAAADASGNVYVADADSNTIRRITPAGVVSTLAGTAGKAGHAEGKGGDASFNFPMGIAVDAARKVLYVADSSNDTIRMITFDGVVTTIAGTATLNGTTDKPGADARFYDPEGVAVDPSGNVYVADTYNNVIRKITPAGGVTTLAGNAPLAGADDGQGVLARFAGPRGVATDSVGNVYVADTDNNTIRKIDKDGNVITLAGKAGEEGSADGMGADARFNFPRDVAVDSANNVYVADTNNSTIRKITPEGVVTTVVGVPGSIGARLGPLPGSLNNPLRLAILPGLGTRLVEVDSENGVLQITLP